MKNILIASLLISAISGALLETPNALAADVTAPNVMKSPDAMKAPDAMKKPIAKKKVVVKKKAVTGAVK
jgi:hypothetical protein